MIKENNYEDFSMFDEEDIDQQDVINNDDILKDEDNNNDDDLFKEDYNDDYSSENVPMEKHADLLKQLTNFDRYIKAKINGWLGLKWDQLSGKYIDDPEVEPIMNKKCAAWCVDYMKTYTRDNNIITNLDETDYINLRLDIVDVLWYNLGARAEEFGIKNNGDLLRINTEMQHAAELVLMGAGGGKYNEFLGGTMKRNENITQNGSDLNNNNQKGSWVDKLKRLANA